MDGDNKYECAKCKKLVAATSRFSLETPPACLAVHLKRFDFHRGGGRTKITGKVGAGASGCQSVVWGMLAAAAVLHIAKAAHPPTPPGF